MCMSPIASFCKKSDVKTMQQAQECIQSALGKFSEYE